ncbi:MAG: fumarylacetoacetate hydrolase family protein [Salinibacterium sp.]|nr:fumarylacetoacetate hydrolase family protein [Salinibacterium sp.]
MHNQTPSMPTPGKIIAVHLSYPSRTAQRGRTPEAPSYFIKAISSIAASGGTVVRPLGTELLAFEGEIAVVIGEPARHVDQDDAWGYVAYVTASNDLGVYDLRAIDKGSNVRSKSGDGFTPLGPDLIPATGLTERDFRVRAWKNGELVQDDSSDTLLFPFSQLIADLSQIMTLETGDIILTGTPAGSSVIVPGDTIEVEVDVPRTGQSSGRLTTTVVEGAIAFNPAYGTAAQVDDKQREEAWGSRAQAGLPELPERFQLTAELRATLEATPVSTLSSALRKRGHVDIFIDGVTTNQPGTRIVGQARTLRFVPFRPDLFASRGGGFNAQKQAFDSVGAGEILVIDARGERETGTVGDILALRARLRGAAGIVTDGGVRDWAQVKEIGIPVFSQGSHPSVLGRRHVPWEVDATIACGGAAVVPGDVIVGDDDGVIVIPAALVAEVAVEAAAQEFEDAWVAEQVEAGNPIDGLFPPNAEWTAKFEGWKASKGGPT